jgi:hypothetical protein
LLAAVVAWLLTGWCVLPYRSAILLSVNQHMRWELNDLARRLQHPPPYGSMKRRCMRHASASSLTPITAASGDRQPEDEREVSAWCAQADYLEAAEVIGVSAKMQRRANRRWCCF